MRNHYRAILILFLFVWGNNTPAYSEEREDTGQWNAPILIFPEEGGCKVSASGQSIQDLLTVESIIPESDSEFIEVSHTGGELICRIANSPVNGKIFNSDNTEFSNIYIPPGWELNLDIREDRKMVLLRSEVEQHISETRRTSEISLPPYSNFTVIIFGDSIRGSCFLPERPFPMVENPIRTVQLRSPAGNKIEYSFGASGLIDEEKSRIAVLFYSMQQGEFISARPMILNRLPESGLRHAEALLPPPVESWFWWYPEQTLKAVVLVTGDKGEPLVQIDEITVTNRLIGVFWGLVLLGGLFLLSFALTRGGILKLAMTPQRRYSISKAQILWWTAIVLFAFAYVFYSRGYLLNVTEQILILLGISGATAVIAKATSMTRLVDVPFEFTRFLEKNRKPRLRDMFTIGDQPEVFKFQIFSFTIVAGIFVVFELWRGGNFPVLDPGILTLMGISGSVYIGSEIAHSNVWADIDKLVKKVEEKRNELRYTSDIDVEYVDDEKEYFVRHYVRYLELENEYFALADDEKKTDKAEHLKKCLDALGYKIQIIKMLKNIYGEDWSAWVNEARSRF